MTDLYEEKDDLRHFEKKISFHWGELWRLKMSGSFSMTTIQTHITRAIKDHYVKKTF